jgi:hypothetical protein
MDIKSVYMNACRIILLISFSFCVLNGHAQNDSTVYFKGAIKENRDREYHNIIKNIINKNLSLTLTDSTEDNWQDALWALEVLRYKTPWVTSRIYAAFDSAGKRSISFQQALLNLAYTNYADEFEQPVTDLLNETKDTKTFALCAEYLLQNDPSEKTREWLAHQLEIHNELDTLTKNDSSIAYMLGLRLQQQNKINIRSLLPQLLSDKFLPQNIVVFSFQRKNRDYPGITIVRDKDGNFLKDEYGDIFFVPQLARSITNLPFYLSDGNTPQGIFKMDGLDVSRVNYIGPTENIQLRIPFETSIRDFLNDTTITDSVWTEDLYKKLLPENCKNYPPLYETYFAGKAGRTEIIAHGTTIDPEYYSEQPYYPNTPTEGCLCAKEIWSEENGKRLQSDQQQLVDAVKKAGGANGYYVVIEIDDTQKPVDIKEILPFIQ